MIKYLLFINAILLLSYFVYIALFNVKVDTRAFIPFIGVCYIICELTIVLKNEGNSINIMEYARFSSEGNSKQKQKQQKAKKVNRKSEETLLQFARETCKYYNLYARKSKEYTFKELLEDRFYEPFSKFFGLYTLQKSKYWDTRCDVAFEQLIDIVCTLYLEFKDNFNDYDVQDVFKKVIVEGVKTIESFCEDNKAKEATEKQKQKEMKLEHYNVKTDEIVDVFTKLRV